jgi:hypothetical protein
MLMYIVYGLCMCILIITFPTILAEFSLVAMFPAACYFEFHLCCIRGVHMQTKPPVLPLDCSWNKLLEIMKHMDIGLYWRRQINY